MNFLTTHGSYISKPQFPWGKRSKSVISNFTYNMFCSLSNSLEHALYPVLTPYPPHSSLPPKKEKYPPPQTIVYVVFVYSLFFKKKLSFHKDANKIQVFLQRQLANKNIFPLRLTTFSIFVLETKKH